MCEVRYVALELKRICRFGRIGTEVKKTSTEVHPFLGARRIDDTGFFCSRMSANPLSPRFDFGRNSSFKIWFQSSFRDLLRQCLNEELRASGVVQHGESEINRISNLRYGSRSGTRWSIKNGEIMLTV